jgi:hypothetical protein
MRPPKPRPRRTAPLPPQSGRGRPATAERTASPPDDRPAASFVRSFVRSARGLVQAVRRMPNPRLTGIGIGLFCCGSMFMLACVDEVVFGGSLIVYGVLFLPVSALTALWVRPADLVTAPIVVPIAFVVGLLPITEGSGGFGERIMGLVTALAMHAGWLYGGTLITGVITTVRKVRLMARRRAQLRRRPPRPPRPRRRTA